MGYDVRDSFRHEEGLVYAMLNIIKFMSEAEKEHMCAHREKDVTFIEALRELRNLSLEWEIFEGLPEVLSALGNEVIKKEESETEDDVQAAV